MQENLSANPDRVNFYASPGNVRNIGFSWPDGKFQSFNYAYLVTHEYLPQDGLIRLEFTTHTITIKGYDLEALYFDIFDQLARIISCIDQRYTELTEKKSVVNEILVASNGT